MSAKRKNPEQQPAHSRIGASSMYRWAACPGSVRATKGLPNTTSMYAAEGTVAHDIAANCLNLGINAGAFANETRECEGHQILVDAEMVDSVNEYTAYILGLKAQHEGAELRIEHRFDLSALYPGLFGTADAVLWLPDLATLVVADLKYGKGRAVEVDDNPQLNYYALGALLTAGFPAKRVRKVIAQPRCPHTKGPFREQEIDAIDMLDFRADLLNYAKATEIPDAPLAAGDHCDFCPAAGICPELNKRTMSAAQAQFAVVPAAGTAVYDPAMLAKALDNVPFVEAWLKNVREFAYREAEAGRCPPGWKLVAKRARRHWKDEAQVIEALQDMGVTDDVLYEPRDLKSPAQIEASGVSKKFVAMFTNSISSGHTLAPEGDERAPVKSSAVADFAGAALPT